MSKKTPVWDAFRVKRSADGSRRSRCVLKKKDGNDCTYFYDQKEKDCSTSTLIKHVKNNHPEEYENIFNKSVDAPAQKKISVYALTEEEIQIKTAKHFFLASLSSVESESFFSDATSIFSNKQRNKFSSAQKLLHIKVMLKRNIAKVESSYKEKEESDSGEEF